MLYSCPVFSNEKKKDINQRGEKLIMQKISLLKDLLSHVDGIFQVETLSLIIQQCVQIQKYN